MSCRPKVWTVKHRDGWCAVKDNTEPAEGSVNVATLCGFFVVLPFGYDRSQPDCSDCLALLGFHGAPASHRSRAGRDRLPGPARQSDRPRSTAGPDAGRAPDPGPSAPYGGASK